MDEVTCRACGTVFDRYDIRCPSCGTVTVTKPSGEEKGTCRICRLFGGAALLLAVFWLFILLRQMP